MRLGKSCRVWGMVGLLGVVSASGETGATLFHRLEPGPAPSIIAAAEAFPGGGWEAENLLKPAASNGGGAAYASRGKGTETFVDFDFGQPVRLAGFRHVQRKWPDTIAGSVLLFSDTPDFAASKVKVPVAHVDESEAVTVATFSPVTARYVRWQVTSRVKGTSPNVGGNGVVFFVAGPEDSKPDGIGVAGRTVQVIDRTDGKFVQPLVVTLESPYAEAVQAMLRIDGQTPQPVDVTFGKQTVPFVIEASDTARVWRVSLETASHVILQREIEVAPATRRTVYILPHSHTDIGYTAVQTDIEEKQVNNLLLGMAEARRTADYPAGSRFIWNVEVLWAADLFLQRMPEERRDAFITAVKNGQVALNGMYLNELTGLCRPEELIRLFRFASKSSAQTGVPVDAAMISDVPGYTWGTVTAMAQAGVRYLSAAPNYFDRIGTILVEWENKPFWWVGPDGQSKVLVWIPFWGYAMSMRYRDGGMSRRWVEDFCEGLEKRGYPYDIAYVRWAGYGDNAVPDGSVCEFVRDWNAAHAWPRFVISSTSEAFRAFEKKYGERLPNVRGEWSPYWEDGAGSSAEETALNRTSSARLAQAEALWAMLAPKRYPASRFEAAWNNVLLYSEHTWGAFCSITEPDNPFTVDQWTVKRSYATAASLQSRQLLSEAAQGRVLGSTFRVQKAAVGDRKTSEGEAVDVYNTSSWPRTEVVLLPHELTAVGNRVLDGNGRAVPAQRLANRELAVLVKDLPPFAGRRYRIVREGDTKAEGPGAVADGVTVDNGIIHVRVDTRSGGISELWTRNVATNLAAIAEGRSLNDYLYLVGDDLAALQHNGPVRITLRDRGPLVASLLIESDAPGCHALSRELRLVAGGDYVECLNTVDKRRLEAKSYRAVEGKESVNFAFPFNVPDGEIRMDVPFGVFRPERDQMPSACKNWLTLGSWADVANREYGVLWVTLDAPLVQVGGLTATLLNSQTDPSVWRKTIEPTQTLVSWAMNNHWGTNYRAYQEGPVCFRFILRPHRGSCDDAEASRFASRFSQPLVAVPGRGVAPDGCSLLRVVPSCVQVAALKPSDDGQALIVRLFNTGALPAEAQLDWGRKTLRRLWLSDTGERPGKRLSSQEAITLPPSGVVTLRAELAK